MNMAGCRIDGLLLHSFNGKSTFACIYVLIYPRISAYLLVGQLLRPYTHMSLWFNTRSSSSSSSLYYFITLLLLLLLFLAFLYIVFWRSLLTLVDMLSSVIRFCCCCCCCPFSVMMIALLWFSLHTAYASPRLHTIVHPVLAAYLTLCIQQHIVQSDPCHYCGFWPVVNILVRSVGTHALALALTLHQLDCFVVLWVLVLLLLLSTMCVRSVCSR